MGRQKSNEGILEYRNFIKPEIVLPVSTFPYRFLKPAIGTTQIS